MLQCAGSIEATRTAIGIVATNGRVAIEGVVGGWDEIGVSPDRLVAKQCVVRGVRGWTVPDFSAALEYNSRGLVELGPIITHHFPLQSYEEALQLAFGGGRRPSKWPSTWPCRLEPSTRPPTSCNVRGRPPLRRPGRPGRRCRPVRAPAWARPFRSNVHWS